MTDRKKSRFTTHEKRQALQKASTVCLFITAAILITTGVILGQPESVLSKAAAICLECIGIG